MDQSRWTVFCLFLSIILHLVDKNKHIRLIQDYIRYDLRWLDLRFEALKFDSLENLTKSDYPIPK